MGQKLRNKNKLTPLALKKLKAPGRYSDGNNLYLKIEDTGSRRWILRLSVNGKRRDMGLGNLSFVNLSDARGLNYQIILNHTESSNKEALIFKTCPS